RIVAIVDVFDALTSDRPYRAAWPFHRAVSILQEEAGKAFDPRYLRVFLARIAPYPIGERVRLNTEHEAVVVRLNPAAPDRPVVDLDPTVGEIYLSRERDICILGPA